MEPSLVRRNQALSIPRANSTSASASGLENRSASSLVLAQVRGDHVRQEDYFRIELAQTADGAGEVRAHDAGEARDYIVEREAAVELRHAHRGKASLYRAVSVPSHPIGRAHLVSPDARKGRGSETVRGVQLRAPKSRLLLVDMHVADRKGGSRQDLDFDDVGKVGDAGLDPADKMPLVGAIAIDPRSLPPVLRVESRV